MSALVIVAIPSEDDYVMKVSSEKIPHLTLLYLGESGTVDNLEEIMLFVEHASTLIEPFYMDVEYRGTLGEDDADVLFFEKGWDYKMVQTYRDQLKQNAAIKAAYNSTEQFPEWRPHLTLGYPETPANKPDEDRKIYSVCFDRIAVWDGDFKGMEFRLKRKMLGRDLVMAEVAADETALQHYGIKGMRWGVRTARVPQGGIIGEHGGHGSVQVSTRGGAGAAGRADKALRPTRSPIKAVREAKQARYEKQTVKREGRFPTQETQYRVSIGKKGNRQIETRGGKGHEPAPEAVSARILNQQRKASGTQSLSNQQLRELATRLQLEKQIADLTRPPSSNSKTKDFIMKQLGSQKDRDKNIRNGKELIGMAEKTKSGSKVVRRGKVVAARLATI